MSHCLGYLVTLTAFIPADELLDTSALDALHSQKAPAA